MLERVRRTIAEHGMLAPGDGVVVAVSGGVDSMVLLHVLASLRGALGIRLHAAHLDHGLRGPEAARDAAAVAAWADRLGVPAVLGRAGALDRRGGSLQRAARDARYAFLERVADRVGAARIALGHTRDDVAETLLLNLVRGAGLRGLAAIPPVRGRIVRPLLDVPRDAIVAHARAHGVPWVEDPSNRAAAYRRNRVRLEVLPALAAALNPQVGAALARTAAIVRAEDAFLEAAAREAFARHGRACPPGQVALDGEALRREHPVLRRRVLRAAAEGLPGRPIFSERRVADLEAWLLAGPRAGRRALRRDVAAWWAGGELLLGPPPAPPPAAVVYLPLGAETVAAPFGMAFRAEAAAPAAYRAAPRMPLVAWIDAAAAPGPMSVRGWRPGDRFRPLGLGGTKKLQDFFVDAKVPRARRARVPLLVSGERILWVVGHRLDEAARVSAATREVIKITARPVGVPHG